MVHRDGQGLKRKKVRALHRRVNLSGRRDGGQLPTLAAEPKRNISPVPMEDGPGSSVGIATGYGLESASHAVQLLLLM